MKSPDEIKKGLDCCTGEGDFRDCDSCPYLPVIACQDVTRSDALAYIQQLEAQNDTIMQSFQRLKKVCVAQGTTIRQLEAERDAAVKDLKTAKRCKVCKHNHISEMVDPCFSCSCCCGVNNFEWRGVQKEE